MKKSEFKQLIREEIRKVLKEAVTIDPSLVNKLKVAIAARRRDREDENAYTAVIAVLTQIFKKAGQSDAKKLATGAMEDERMDTISGAMSVIKDTLSSRGVGDKPTNSVEIMDKQGNMVATVYKESGEVYVEFANGNRYYTPFGMKASIANTIDSLQKFNGVTKSGSMLVADSNLEKRLNQPSSRFEKA